MGYKPILEEIIPRLWVGDKEAVPTAERRKFSILAACKDGSPDCHRAVLGYSSLAAPHDKNYYFYRSDTRHMALNLLDVDDPTMIPDEVIDKGLAFIDERMNAGDNVLSHCIAGHTRGPIMAMLYLRTIGELPQSFRRAEQIFKTLYRAYDPGQGMEYHARVRWDELKDIYGKRSVG